MLNDRRDYPLESKLRSIAMNPGSYIVAMFDCCREKYTSAMQYGGGGGSTNGEDMNIVISFGCALGSLVPEDNQNMSVDYFEFLKRRSHPDDGSVILPDLLNYWKGADGCAET